MVHIYRIALVHKTGRYLNDGTHAAFELQLDGPAGTRKWKVPDDPQVPDEREKGQADYYKMDVPGAPYDYDEFNSTVTLRVTTKKDDWVPKAVFVMGQTVPDANRWVLLGATIRGRENLNGRAEALTTMRVSSAASSSPAVCHWGEDKGPGECAGGSGLFNNKLSPLESGGVVQTDHASRVGEPEQNATARGGTRPTDYAANGNRTASLRR